jgi:hypothetical protein
VVLSDDAVADLRLPFAAGSHQSSDVVDRKRVVAIVANQSPCAGYP